VRRAGAEPEVVHHDHVVRRRIVLEHCILRRNTYAKE
jgi:hypothetical protein